MCRGYLLIFMRAVSASTHFSKCARCLPVHTLRGGELQHHRSRLETRAKEYSMCASLRVSRNPVAKSKQGIGGEAARCVAGASSLAHAFV